MFGQDNAFCNLSLNSTRRLEAACSVQETKSAAQLGTVAQGRSKIDRKNARCARSRVIGYGANLLDKLPRSD